jgi:hypothetical protein
MHQYTIPPNKLIGISQRRLKLSPRSNNDTHLAIDHFFRTVANDELARFDRVAVGRELRMVEIEKRSE